MADHVLITGGAGFIGTRLARRLTRAGHTVTVLDALIAQVHGDDPATTSPLLRSLDGVAEVLEGSVTSRDDLRRALQNADVVVHLAAETGTGQSMYEIDRYVETNVGGTAKLLDILTNEDHQVRRLVIASSRSIYGEGAYRTEDGRVVYPGHRADADMASGDFEVHLEGEGPLTLIPTDEDAKLHPSSVYGITKQMQESLIMTVAPTIGIEPVSLRYQNVYGPGQSLKNPYTGILSIFSTLLLQGKDVNIFEDGKETRDFVFIDDVVAATVSAIDADVSGQAFNVGTGEATDVITVASALKDAYGKGGEIRISGNYRIGDIRHNFADLSRAEAAIGYRPRVTFAEGVKRFAAWVLTQQIEDSGYQRSVDEMRAKGLLK